MSTDPRTTKPDDPMQRLLDQLNATAPAPRAMPRMVSINWTIKAARLVHAAAKERGISLSGFCRRASVAMACQVLGLDYYEQSVGERGVRAYGEAGGDPKVIAESKDGQGYGEWRIRELG